MIREVNIRPSGPDLVMLRVFHTHRWGYVRLFRLPDGDFERVGAKSFTEYFPVRSLEWFHSWPAGERKRFLQQLGEDSFSSIHTLYGVPTQLKQASYTRLNAAWVDLDYGHSSDHMSSSEAIEALDQLIADAVLPPVSILEHTGRGLRVYWMLTECEDLWQERVHRSVSIQALGYIPPVQNAEFVAPDDVSTEQLLDLTRWRPHRPRWECCSPPTNQQGIGGPCS